MSDFTAQLRQQSGYASLDDERQQSADETERIDGKRKPPRVSAGRRFSGGTNMWFSFDGDTFETHETREDAQKAAQDALDDCRADAVEGWPDEVYRICWGQIVESATVTMEREKTEDDYVDSSIDLIQEIKLRPSSC